jgi:hypothetical protein
VGVANPRRRRGVGRALSEVADGLTDRTAGPKDRNTAREAEDAIIERTEEIEGMKRTTCKANCRFYPRRGNMLPPLFFAEESRNSVIGRSPALSCQLRHSRTENAHAPNKTPAAMCLSFLSQLIPSNYSNPDRLSPLLCQIDR